MSTVQSCFAGQSPWESWGGVTAAPSWKQVPHPLEDEEKQLPFWATCQELLISGRESELWKVTATTISQ